MTPNKRNPTQSRNDLVLVAGGGGFRGVPDVSLQSSTDIKGGFMLSLLMLTNTCLWGFPHRERTILQSHFHAVFFVGPLPSAGYRVYLPLSNQKGSTSSSAQRLQV